MAAALAAAGGCDGHARWWDRPDPNLVKPTVAVMKFENRAPFPLGWNLGDGMKDVLVDRLVATGRFTVVERPELASVMKELRLQHSGATRGQRRAALGRLKNVQYLIKGTITDFGHVSRRRGMFEGLGLGIFGGGARAVMGMTMYVVDVESGEIICSESLTESVRAGDTAVKAEYKAVAFGGSSFYRKPLGRATARVIDKAVRRIGSVIACRPWQAKIALVQDGGTVLINGGRDRGVEAGLECDVFEAGEPIHDPDTGDRIGTQPGKLIGRIRITRVRARYSEAHIVSGKPEGFRVGQQCRAPGLVAAR
jgi:curli biogenesis system outer membrane secretion channel CsgG